jgi:hypothetical protein
MARWLPVLSVGGGVGSGGFLLVVTCVLAVAAVVIVSCAIHLHFHAKDDKTRGAAITRSASAADPPADGFHGFKCLPKYSGRALISSSRKQLISKKWWRNEEEDEVKAYDRAVMEEEGGGDSLWQRTILMGEKCQPPDFSGAIIYDDKGNQLTEFPPRSPKLNIFHPSLEQPDAVQQR